MAHNLQQVFTRIPASDSTFTTPYLSVDSQPTNIAAAPVPLTNSDDAPFAVDSEGIPVSDSDSGSTEIVFTTPDGALSVDASLAAIQKTALDLWDGTLSEILEPALKYLKPVVNFVIENPWVLIPLIVPIFEVWLAAIGFQAGGVVLGSIAAIIQSRIGNVPKGSLFAFLQHYGAGRIAKTAVRMGGVALLIAVVLAAAAKILIENSIGEERIQEIVEGVWHKVCLPKVPDVPIEGAGNTLTSSPWTVVAAGYAAWALGVI